MENTKTISCSILRRTTFDLKHTKYCDRIRGLLLLNIRLDPIYLDDLIIQTFEMQCIVNFFGHQIFVHVVISIASAITATTLYKKSMVVFQIFLSNWYLVYINNVDYKIWFQVIYTFSNTSIFSWVCSSKMLFDRARMISNLNSIIGRTISKNSLTLVPWIWGKIWNQGKGLTQISFIRKMHRIGLVTKTFSVHFLLESTIFPWFE